MAKIALVALVVVHLALLVRGGSDPHKLFGFRPFNESDTYRAEIVRVDAAGERRPVNDGTWAHDWNALVGTAKLTDPWRTRHAAAGADASVDFLHRALVWVLDTVDDDPDTAALEATVTIHRNTRGAEVVVLRAERNEPDR